MRQSLVPFWILPSNLFSAVYSDKYRFHCVQSSILALICLNYNLKKTMISRWVHNSAWWYRFNRVIVANDSLGYAEERSCPPPNSLCVFCQKTCRNHLLTQWNISSEKYDCNSSKTDAPRQKKFARASPRWLKGSFTLGTTNELVSTNSCWENLLGVEAKFWVVKNFRVRKGWRR